MTVHRFVHIGDIHLGPNGRNADRRRALEQIVGECEYVDNLAAWLIPGDLNHGRMTIEDRNYLADIIRRMAYRAPVFIVEGNHDIPGDLRIFEALQAKYRVVVVDASRGPQVIAERAPDDWPFVVFNLPYPSKACLVRAGVPHEQLVNVGREALEHILRGAQAEMQRWSAAGYAPLAIGHINVGGSIASSGQPNIGREIELDPVLLQMYLPGMYVGLNHIHKAQRYYAGSVCRLDWGETEPKTYTVVEVSPNALGGGWVYLENRLPINVAPMYHVEGKLSREGFDWQVRKGPGGPVDEAPASWEGCEVRVRYTYDAAEKPHLDENLIRAPFAGALRLEPDPIAVRARAVRAPEVAAETSLEGKIAAFAKVTPGIAWTESTAAKLALLLSHVDDATFFADVTAALGPNTPPLTQADDFLIPYEDEIPYEEAEVSQ